MCVLCVCVETIGSDDAFLTICDEDGLGIYSISNVCEVDYGMRSDGYTAEKKLCIHETAFMATVWANFDFTFL